jgi:hypothetical protein
LTSNLPWIVGTAAAAAMIVIAVSSGCDGPSAESTPPASAAPVRDVPAPVAAAPAARRGPAPIFVDVAKEAGITAMNHTGKAREKDWIVSGMGGGTIVLDYDQDGRMDFVLVDGTMLTEEGELRYDDEARTRLYRNEGGMRFTDVTAKAGIDLKAFGFGGAACDYDADGFPDFYVCCWGPSHLFRNRGDGTFEDVTAKSGVSGASDDMATSCCFGDVDGDGIVDLYVAIYLDQRKVIEAFKVDGKKGGRWAIWRGFRVYVGPQGLPAQKDRLYLGKADGTFTEVTDTHLGPQSPPRYGFQPMMSDLDNDGDLDIYVANDTEPNYLWLNDGRGKFAERGVETGVAYDFDAKSQASMGVDVADVNRDGWFDIVVTNFSHDHVTVYENEKKTSNVLTFTDKSAKYQVTRPSYLKLQWGTRFFDYDNDGNLDLFVACGHVYGEIEHFEQQTGSGYRQSCMLLRGVGPPTFAFEDSTDPKVDPRTGGPAFAIKRVWRGAAFADFDDDGDQDVFVTALNDYPALFKNEGGERNEFLAFRLVGKGKLRDPCGARVTVWLADGRPRMEELHHGASFCCDNDPRLFFGLGDEKSAKRVDVRWPDGSTQSFENVAARKFYVVEQGKDGLAEDKR